MHKKKERSSFIIIYQVGFFKSFFARMRALEYILNVFSILIITYMKTAKANTAVYICESEDPLFLGSYGTSRETMDGVQVFTNSNDMSFFRNKGFWYVGNLAPWPPETHYRCVEPEGCNFNGAVPPTSLEGEWKGAKRFGKNKAPVISFEPCSGAADEL
jgi:hypothetical protein